MMIDQVTIQTNATSGSAPAIAAVVAVKDEFYTRGYYGAEDKLAWLEIPDNDPDDGYNLPDSMTEEELDQFLIDSGVLDILLSQVDAAPRGRNWEDELNEL